MKAITILLFTLLAASFATAQEVRIGEHLTLDPGTKMHVDANLGIQAAELTIQPGASLIMGDGRTLSVNDGGTIKALGNETNQAIVSSTGYLVFIVNDGGTIGASHSTFEKMSGGGLTIEPGATIDPGHPLSNCTFQNGSNGSTLLTINNHQHLTIEGAIFISSPGMELHNVAKTLNQGIVNFINYSGNFAGEDFEDDDYNRIFWGAEADFQQLVDGITAGEDVSLCFDALDVITVEDLLVDNGGMVNLVAGQRILLLPGVLVQNNGYLHAWISTDGIFCQPPSMLASSEPEPEPQSQPLNPHETAIKIYPNPTSGDFTMELHGFEESETVLVQIFSMQGKLLSAQELPASSLYSMSLAGRQPGIYLIRVMMNGQTGVTKVVKK